ncbi:Nup85 nucleoporin-domain-containing protein [Flagelloscypha sp. PMI_526]|nr:Nup85 nucleoporin-domain-containing protein [Flagelloscypha sp. PMI_526]
MAHALHLLPPLVKHGQSSELLNSGQTLYAALSPRNSSGVAFVANTEAPQKAVNGHVESIEQQPVYFFGVYPHMSPDRRLFITDTFKIFAGIQRHIEEDEKGWTGLRQFCIDHINFIRECWSHMSKPDRDTSIDGPYDCDHYSILCSCFYLFLVLFLAEFGYDRGPIGEDLMDWLNRHFIEPSTEEGDQLSSLGKPWEDDAFWPYLTRTILRGLSKASQFFLNTLSQHPVVDLQELSSKVSVLVRDQPRLSTFSSEREFNVSFRKWRDRVMAVRIEMDKVPDEDRVDDMDNWWDRLSDIVGILEGRDDVLKRVCEELGADWKEVCAAWGIFVDPGLRRQELGTLWNIYLQMPEDIEDAIHAAMFTHDLEAMLERAAQLDPWLSAHMVQFLDPLYEGFDIPKDDGLSYRQHYILDYAGYLQSDNSLWSETTEYMFTCGRVGVGRADELLLRVALTIVPPDQTQAMQEDEADPREGEVNVMLRQLSEKCRDHDREPTRRAILKIAAQTLVRAKRFGIAISYYLSAEDWPGLGYAVDRILDVYVESGAREFTTTAFQITPSLPALTQNSGVFSHRLLFVRHREAAMLLVSILERDIAPNAWKAVLLVDSMEYLHGTTLLYSSQDATRLLQRLEEISLFINSSPSSSLEYLHLLARLKGGERDALLCLKALRLSLARYFALAYQQPNSM